LNLTLHLRHKPLFLMWRSGAIPDAAGATNYLALTPPSRAATASAAHQNPSSFLQSLFRPDICTGRASFGIKGASMSHYISAVNVATNTVLCSLKYFT
jgi:hypothetical protein